MHLPTTQTSLPLAFAAALVAATATFATAQSAAEQPEQPPLALHEWGTFTSFVGSDGLVLDGLQHEEERLPSFVHELAELDAVPGARALKFPASRVTQKMETPVIYFHTDVRREVQVTVTLDKGILTQFYPIPAVVAPPLSPTRTAPIDLTTIEDSMLHWQLELVPQTPGMKPPSGIPECDPEDPWAIARDVRAAYVRTLDPKGIQRAVETEHYVFYRGLGRFTLPIELRAENGGTGSFTNHTTGQVPFAAVLDVSPDGSRWQELGSIGSGEQAAFTIEGEMLTPRHAAAQLGARVFEALVREGLFEDEARAMIATWSRSWFQSRGTRVIYILPRAEVERVLPLKVRPTPDELVRVLVGRLEFIRPEQEVAVENALLARLSPDARVRTDAEHSLVALDRFLEPHVRRARARTEDARVRESATQVLLQIERSER